MPRHDEGFFSAKDNLRLFWESELPDGEARAHVVLAHGYQDHLGRSRGIMASLVAAGFGVHGYDFRGHGKSDGRRGHCGAFSEYLDDFELFLERTRRAAGARKLFLLAHSHGALVAIHWLAKKGASGFSAAAFSAPFLKLALEPPRTKVLGAKVAGLFVPWLPVKSELGVEELSRDVEVQKAAARDPLYNKTVTPRWFGECQKAQAQAITFGPRIDLPVFVFLGEKDKVAAPEVGRAFYESLASRDKKFKEYPLMRHEPMNEIGKEEVHADVVGWISSHL